MESSKYAKLSRVASSGNMVNWKTINSVQTYSAMVFQSDCTKFTSLCFSVLAAGPQRSSPLIYVCDSMTVHITHTHTHTHLNVLSAQSSQCLKGTFHCSCYPYNGYLIRIANTYKHMAYLWLVHTQVQTHWGRQMTYYSLKYNVCLRLNL